MRRTIGLISTMVLVLALALPAAGDIDQNPNATAFGPGECSNGDTFALAVSPTDPSVFAKELVMDGLRGVAKAIYATDEDGNAVLTFWERPGAGLDALTVRCWWEAPFSPTGYIGGDILFSGNSRN